MFSLNVFFKSVCTFLLEGTSLGGCSSFMKLLEAGLSQLHRPSEASLLSLVLLSARRRRLLRLLPVFVMRSGARRWCWRQIGCFSAPLKPVCGVFLT